MVFSNGVQQILVAGFPAFDIVRRSNQGPITLIIPHMILTQLTDAENPDAIRK